MKNLFVLSALLLTLTVGNALAQGVREPVKSAPPAATADGTQDSQNSSIPKPQPAPNSFAAQYEGGMFGYSEKIKGTLHFDDANKRLVFRNKEGKEVFGLPYKSLMVVQGDSRKYRPTGATVATVIPIPGAGLFGLISSKHRYLSVQFNDPDSDVRGGASFKVANKELLRSAIYSLGEKAELKQRGDAFYRPRETSSQTL